MTDEEKLNALDNLLSSGLIGINGDEFVFNQSAILSAMAKTDRELLVRILAKLSLKSPEKLLEESVESDIKHLTELLSSTSKVIK